MDCKLIRPRGMEEALVERGKYAREGMPIAGGQSLLVMLRNRMITPRALIDMEFLQELQGIRQGSEGMSIGAMTSFYTLLSSREIQKTIPILAQAASKVSSTPIRNLGTIGGNICHNELGADLPPSILTLDAKAELRSRKGIRRVPLVDFFRDYFETALEPDEILCSVEVPRLPQGAAGVYLKHAISPEDVAMVGVAAILVPDGGRKGRVSELRLGLGGVAPVPFRATKAERAVKGEVLNAEAIHEVGEIAAGEAEPVTDAHASADYRKKMVKVFVRRAITGALEKIGSDAYAHA